EDHCCSSAPALPRTCAFQLKYKERQGKETVLCILPHGVCPLQAREKDKGNELVVCSQPHTVLSDWQIVELDQAPVDAVRRYMTADPVMVAAGTPVRELARQMIDAHIHRVIVVDEQQRPIGIVASTDVLAAVAYAEDPETEEIAI